MFEFVIAFDTSGDKVFKSYHKEVLKVICNLQSASKANSPGLTKWRDKKLEVFVNSFAKTIKDYCSLL